MITQINLLRKKCESANNINKKIAKAKKNIYKNRIEYHTSYQPINETILTILCVLPVIILYEKCCNPESIFFHFVVLFIS